MAFVLDCSVNMAWMFRDEATDATVDYEMPMYA